jgi:hypothetical protein
VHTAEPVERMSTYDRNGIPGLAGAAAEMIARQSPAH